VISSTTVWKLKGNIFAGAFFISSEKEIVIVSIFSISRATYFVSTFTIQGADQAHRQADIPASFAIQSFVLDIFIPSLSSHKST
jgi:hypothetical protein